MKGKNECKLGVTMPNLQLVVSTPVIHAINRMILKCLPWIWYIYFSTDQMARVNKICNALLSNKEMLWEATVFTKFGST